MEEIQDTTKKPILYTIKNGTINGGDIMFELNDGTSFTSNETISICDPAYDSIFKKIFEEENCIKKISGKQRLIHFLNSILYPSIKGTKKIVDINKTSNEVTNLNSNGVNNLRFDICCEIKVKDVSTESKLIDVEMQLSNDPSMIERLFIYASSIYKTLKRKTIVIGLINQETKNKKYNSSSIQLIQSYNKENTENNQLELDLIKIIIINIKEEIENMNKNTKIIINNQELGDHGKNWIKFFGLRHWGLKHHHKYLLPSTTLFSSNELDSAVNILRSVSNIQLESIINDELYKVNVETSKYNEGKEEGRREGKEEGRKEGKEEGKKIEKINSLIKIFKKERSNMSKFINFICDEDYIFKKQDIKSQWVGEDSSLEEFINLLGKKRKIE